MARKGVFGRAMESVREAEEILKANEAADAEAQAATAEDDSRAAPNVRYFSQSFEEQMLRSLQDVDPDQIDMSRFKDRIDIGADLDDLKRSIESNGQQVPVLLRRVTGGKLEVVYGRRRIMASKQLGRPVRAMIMEMSEEEALIAQGLENAARLENSYIERALFVAQILDAGFTGVTIEKAMRIDESQISRMRGITRDIPRELIEFIGAAHGVGRRPWEDLRKLLQEAKGRFNIDRLQAMVDRSLESPDRFKDFSEKLKQALSRPDDAPAVETKPAKPRVESREIVPGRLTVKSTKRSMQLATKADTPDGFVDYLESVLPELYEKWQRNSNS